MAKKPTNKDAVPVEGGNETTVHKDHSQGKDNAPAVRDMPPANPLGEPVHPVDEYPNISEAGKTAAALGVETEETAGKDKAVGGETIVEHPLSPTDANPNPHGQRDEAFVSVPVKDKDGNVTTSKPQEGNVEITGASDEPVHLGDGRTLAKGEKAKVTAEVAKQLRASGQAK